MAMSIRIGEALEAEARLQNLALGAFAAVDQEAIFVVASDLRGQAAWRMRRSECPEK